MGRAGGAASAWAGLPPVPPLAARPPRPLALPLPRSMPPPPARQRHGAGASAGFADWSDGSDGGSPAVSDYSEESGRSRQRSHKRKAGGGGDRRSHKRKTPAPGALCVGAAVAASAALTLPRAGWRVARRHAFAPQRSKHAPAAEPTRPPTDNSPLHALQCASRPPA